MCLMFPTDFINDQNTIKATSTHILLRKSMKWFLYDRELRHERVMDRNTYHR